MSQCFRITLKFVQKMHAEIIIRVHCQTKFVVLKDTWIHPVGLGQLWNGHIKAWSGLVMVAGDIVERA